MNCTACGQKLVESARFCTSCGQEVVTEVTSSAQAGQSATSSITPATTTKELSADQQRFVNATAWGPTLNWVYLLGNRAWLVGILVFLLAFIPLISILEYIVLIFVGRRIVWSAGKWDNFEQFQSHQRGWDKAGKIFTIVFIIILPLLGVAAALLLFAINPSGRIAEVENTRIKADMGMVITAVEKCHVEKDYNYASCDSIDKLYSGRYLLGVPVSASKITFDHAIDNKNLYISAPLQIAGVEGKGCTYDQQPLYTYSTENASAYVSCASD